ncbi:MAG TPA: Crp/Fnr family transcriptional regulator, partial [Anaerovoracaceae bacterium]|nr:Crp/Fnr family transcriptional regulator [Anaerovoracaceae bacterium]
MMEKDLINSLKSSKLFLDLSESDIGEVCSAASVAVKEYSKNQIIVNQGEPVSKIGVLNKGAVISTKYHYDGNAQIFRIYHHGEALSLDAVNTTLLTSPTTLTSQTDSTVIFLSYKKIFESDSVNPETKKAIMLNSSEILGNELIRLMYKIDVLSKRTLQERILTHLSLMRERTGKDVFDIGMNQEQFAQYLCVNRSVLSKELNKMRKAGLIDYKRNRYKIFFD